MTFALPLGWTGSFDDETSVLHLATGDTTTAASVAFGSPSPEHSGDGLLDRATRFLESDVHRLEFKSWQRSRGRLSVGAIALVESRSAGAGKITNGSAAGHRRSHRTGEITLGDRTYRVRHRSRWRTVVDADGEELAVLTRRVLSRRNRPLDRTALPNVRTAAVTEPDQLVVVLAASAMGPPGRTGFWGELAGELSP